jgi:hypothetical protein
MKDVPVGPDYYKTYNPDLAMRLVTELMNFVPSERLDLFAPPNDTLKIAKKVLTSIAKLVPRLPEVHYKLAHCCFVANDFTNAKRSLQVIV